MNGSCRVAAVCALVGALIVWIGPYANASQILAVYKLSEKAVRCPEGMHAKHGCVELMGRALAHTRWIRMHRVAAVGASTSTIPDGCMSASTKGELSGAQGIVHFTGVGYYCPKRNTAKYYLDFNAADAKRFGLPLHGAINYHGKKSRETFTVGVGAGHALESLHSG